ncbi:homocitrate synthase [uncultured Mycolicibacterium sp.]|uniref:homocitrate synthase n=1 Tax=uncultured Mycolicibacterium sp. TaxID=2320817 RepID=UPI002612E34F|nr:homocitrate synthase [uncultured Mycolicibacterium sp.]
MPPGLREQADGMSWADFLATYAPADGRVRLGHFACAAPAPRSVGPWARLYTYEATLAVGDAVGTCTASASGPIAALTEMLYERGVKVETVGFHQLPTVGARTATIIRGSDGAHTDWGLGLARDATQSALRAVVACANRLLRA